MFAVLRSPDRAQDIPVGDRFIGMIRQIMQDFKFLGREPDVLTFDGYAAVAEVDLDGFQGKFMGA